ncbi:MAG: hypothetical protein ACSLFJ_09745 [Immundisolibacter sp.]|uniref:hypothetical protein n=1 Tax=Immundisolibacter sp. TaxID=1934948 RepID=UPI003EE16942
MRGVWFSALILVFLAAAPALRAHDCVMTDSYASCDDGTTYTSHDGVVVGSDGTTVIRTPDGVYVGHSHSRRGGAVPAPTVDPRWRGDAHPGCKKVDGREVCG